MTFNVLKISKRKKKTKTLKMNVCMLNNHAEHSKKRRKKVEKKIKLIRFMMFIKSFVGLVGLAKMEKRKVYMLKKTKSISRRLLLYV
jgi:hypothetical protein